MTYVAWAVLYEGESDAAYFDVLIPRLMEDLITAGTKCPTIPAAPAVRLRRRTVAEVAEEACKAADAFFFVFIHADTGGRGLAEGMSARSQSYCEAMRAQCDWPPRRCIVIAPRHETEAWVLADAEAITDALGYGGGAASLGLPMTGGDAERLADPKATLQQAISQVRGRRQTIDVSRLFPAVAQRQRLSELRRAPSFLAFEHQLRNALNDLGCL